MVTLGADALPGTLPDYGHERNARRLWRAALVAVLAALLAGCDGAAGERWYTEEQVQRGEAVFEAQCMACHGEGARGDENWRTREPDGNLPPPPLDGSAHAWHHPLDELRGIIAHGQNNMPGFGKALSDEEIDAVIAWFQSLWSDEVYAAWEEYDEAGMEGHADDSR
ncbi:cytochrome c [Aquisalimonas sp. 2447]|uniref:c-type cytochrome n=1 Tax=Aquisalimonas sp. 2447 TaxID=2740807 RepID=UPI0014323034|nr:cytochrome c [Aquisalimonas sp. 2447]QIT56632.1 cytochrome c [Aquisalimonas sp. 2447]